MATPVSSLTDADIEKIDKEKPSVFTDADIESFESRTPSILTDEQVARTEGRDVLQYIKEHPFKTIFQPVSKTLGKPTVQELFERKVAPKIATPEQLIKGVRPELQPAVIGGTIAGTLAGVADIAQTPFSYVPLPVGKLLGKLRIKGVPLEQIMKLPVTKRFFKDVGELGRYFTWLRKPQVSRTATELVRESLNPVNKITKLIKAAKPVRGKQELLYSVERAKRAGKITAIGKEVRGEAGYAAQLGALKGKLPRVQYEGIRNKISQGDVDSLFNLIEENRILSPFEKIRTKTGLVKLLGEEGGAVPTTNELELLGRVFPKEFTRTILSKRPLLQKVGLGLAEVLNIPRAIMASYDLSAPLRQGVFLIGRPKRFASAFGNMFKYFFSEKSYQGLVRNIESRPTYNLMKESGLPLTRIGAPLTQREEAFMSAWAEKIPIVGRGVRASDRAYTGFLNKLRADVFDDLIKSAQKLGIKPQAIADDVSRFVGAATGRGKLGALEPAAIVLNSVFFSPRLMASRLSLLNPAFYVKLNPFVRKEALKSLFTFAGTAATVFGLAKAGGAEIGVNPRSTDFGKIKVGNTRYDILGGFQQYIRLAAQLITGEMVSSTTGVKRTLGEGYKPTTRFDVAQRFLESKENPVTSFAMSLLKGKTFLGEEISIPKEVGLRFTPMLIQDMYDLYQERGIKDIPMIIPAIFGVGVQTYAPTASQIVRSANSVINNIKQLMNQGRTAEVQELYNKNKEMITTGKTLEPIQKTINFIKKAKDMTQKSAIIPKEEKKIRIERYDKLLKRLETQLEERYNLLQPKK